MKEKLKIVPQYIKNVSKSMSYSRHDLFTNIMPTTSDFVSTNSDVFRSVITDMRNLKSVVRQTKKNYESSDANKTVREMKKNLMEDLKTGNWYNKERNDKAMLEASGFGDLFEGFDDFDDWDNEDTDANPISTADKVQTKAAIATANAINVNTNTTLSALETTSKVIAGSMMNSAQMITENQTAINTSNTVNNYKMFNEISGILNDMGTNIRGLFAYTENITKYFNQSVVHYNDLLNKLNEINALTKEFTEMQRNLYAAYNKKDKIEENRNSFISNGTFNIGEYFKNIKKRSKQAYDESMFGMMTSMMSMGDDKNNSPLSLLNMVKGSPAQFISNAIVKASLSKGLEKSMKSFEENFENFFTTALFSMSSKLKEKADMNPFGLDNVLYKVFGLDLGEKRKISTSKYIQGPIPYNGYADKAIVEVIPTYLRKILSAITGQEEMVYNYKTASFTNMTKLKKQFDREEIGTYGMYSTKSKIRETINNTYSFNRNDRERIDKGIDDLIKFLVDKGHFYDPNKDNADKLGELGLQTDYGVLNIITGALNSMDKKDLAKMTVDQFNSMNYRKSANDRMSKELGQSGFAALFNNSSSAVTTNKLSTVTDEYNKTVFNYMRDIRQILLEGINVYSINVSGKKTKQIKPHGKNFDERMKNYSNEVKVTLDNAVNEESEESQLDLMYGNTDDYKDVFNNEKQNRNIMQQLASGIPQNSETSKFISKYSNLFQSIKGNSFSLLDAPQDFIANMLDSVSNNLLYLIYGVKDSDGKTFMQRVSDKVGAVSDKLAKFLDEKVAGPLYDLTMGEHGIVTTLKKHLTPVVNNIKETVVSTVNKATNNLYGKADDAKLNAEDFYRANIQPRMKQIGIGAIAGLGLSFVTPLGLIGGPLLGASVGFASTSDNVKDKLFGKMVDGERQGGLISKNILDKVKGSSKNLKIGLGAGAALGLLTPLGLIGSTMFGGALGFATGIEPVKKFLIGDGNSDGIIPKKWQDKFKEYKPAMIKGAGIGLISSLFLPGGPVGGAVVGLAGSIAMQSDKVKNFLFGDIDPEDGKRHGGLFGRMKEFLKVNVGVPLKLTVKSLLAKGGHFIKTNIINPFLDSLEPLKKQFELAKESFKAQIKAGWESTKNFIGGVFEKHVGKPFGELMREKFIDPMKKFFTNIFSKIGKGIGNVLSIPFKKINEKSKDFMEKQGKDGLIDYDVAKMEENKKKRQEKADKELQEKMDAINKEKAANKKERDYMESENYSNQALANMDRINSLMQDSNKSINKITTVLDTIKNSTQNIAKAVSDAVSETVTGYKNNKKLNERKKAHDAKHQVDTDDVIHLGGATVATQSDKTLNDIKSSGEKTVDVLQDILSAIRSNFKDKKKLKLPETGSGITSSILPSSLGDNSISAGGSHYSGIDYIPNDGYKATLHEGEMVLPKDQANYIRKLLGSSKDGNGFVNSIKDKLQGKMNSNNILTAIYSQVLSIKNHLLGLGSDGKKKKSNKNDDGNKKVKDNIKDIKKDINSIKDDIYGQVNGVGYNTELIANILIDVFGMPSVMPKGIKKGIHIVKGFFSKIFNFIKKPFEFLLKPFKFIKNIFTKITDTVNNFINKIISIPKKILDIGKKALGIVGDIAKSAAKTIGGVVVNIAKAIPSIVKTAGEMITETVKTIGSIAREAIKGLGKVFNSIIEGGVKLAKGLGQLAAKAIPAAIKAFGKVTSIIFNAVKSIGSKIFDLIKKPFQKGKEKISKRNIKSVETVGIVKIVETVENVNSVYEVKKISDMTLYGKLDNIVTAIHSIGSGNSGDNSVDAGTSYEDTKSGEGIFSRLKNKFTGLKDKFAGRNSRNNQQVAAFNTKELAESTARSTEVANAAKTKAMTSINSIADSLKKASKASGLFGILKTVFTIVLPLLKNGGKKLLNWGGKFLKDKMLPWVKEKLLPKISTFLKTKFPAIKNFIGKGGAKLVEWFTKFKSWISTDLKWKFTDARYQAAQAMQSGINAARNGLNAARNGINALKNWWQARKGIQAVQAGGQALSALGGGGAAAGGGLLSLGGGGAATGGGLLSLGGGGAATAGGTALATEATTAAAAGGGGGFLSRLASRFTRRAASNALATTATNIGSNALVQTGGTALATQATTAVTAGGASGISKLLSRIFSCSAMKKLAGSKIGTILGKLGKFLISKLKNAGARFFARLSAKWATITASGAASGMVIPALWIGGSLLLGAAKTNRIFKMDPDYKPSALMKLIAGFANFIANTVTFGIVDASTIAEFIGSFLLKEKDLGEISSSQQKLQEDYENYKAESGDEDITLDEYNKKVNKGLGGKALDAIKTGAKKVGGFYKKVGTKFINFKKKQFNFIDSGIGAIFGLKDDEGNKVKASTWAKDKVKDAAEAVKNKAVDLWNEAGKKMSNIKKGIKKGANYLNTKLGSIFGLEDEKGNPISLTDWGKNKVKDAWNITKNKISDIKKTIGSLWDSLGDTFSQFKKWVSKGADKLNNKLGEWLGFEDENGKPISLTKGIKKSWKSFTNKIKNFYKDEIKPRMKDAGSGDDNSNKGVGSTAISGAVAASNTAGANRKEGLDYVNGMVYYSQSDPKWAQHPYGNSGTISTSGCGPTSAAMVLSTVTSNTVTPAEAGDWSVNHGFRLEGAGTTWDFFPAIARSYGMNLNQVSGKEQIKSALQSGYPVILSGQDARGRNSDNPFTKSGHLVVATGMSSNGNSIIINDPISKERSVAYNFNNVMAKTATGWQSDVKLNEIVRNTSYSSSSGSSSDSSDSSDDSNNSFTNAIEKIAKYTNGLVSSILAGKTFNAKDYDDEDEDGNSNKGIESTAISGAAAASNISGSDTAKSIWNYFTKDAGYSKAATAGIMGNLQRESGLNPAIIQSNGAGPAAGLAQWENYNKKSQRWAALNAYAQSKGKDWTDLGSQLEFIDSELKDLGIFWSGTAMTAAGAPKTTFEQWKNSTDVATATRQFEGAFERGSVLVMDERIANAQKFYNMYKDAGSGDGITTKPNTNIGRPSIATSKVALGQNRALSNSVNDTITVNKITSTGVNSNQLNMIIQLLQNIDDNTSKTADNTSNLVGLYQNTNNNYIEQINTENDYNKSNNGYSKQNALSAATSTSGATTVSSAYENAKRIAHGIY